MNSNVATVERPTEVAKPPHFGAELATKVNAFSAALPKHIPQERFARVIMTAVQRNPDLLRADRQSLWNSAMQAAADGLLPDGREGALVVYNTKDGKGERGKDVWIKKVQWLPMIAGIRKKVRNSGEIVSWNAHVVHENDAFDYELGDDPFVKHKPTLQANPGDVIAAYSIAVLKGGEKTFEVMTRTQLNKVRAASKSPDTGPWKSWFEEMCRKTVAKRHSKVLPMSTDLDDLIRRDDELYDLKGASDRQAGSQRLSLHGKLDAIAAMPDPEQRNTASVDDPEHDPDTGEITDQPAGDAAGDEASANGRQVSPQGAEGAARRQGQQDGAGAGQPASATGDPEKAALMGTLRAKAKKGGKALRLALGGLVPSQNEMLTGDDRAALADIASDADARSDG